MAEDNLKKVWQTLYDDDYDVPDYDTFKADMEDDNNLHDLWEVVGQKYDVPEYEQFRSDMGFGAVAEAPQRTGTVVDQTMEDINRATGHMPQEVQDMAFSGQPQMNGQSLAEKNNPQMFQQPAVDPEPWKAERLTKEQYEDIAWTRAVNAPTRQAVDEQGRIRENAAPGQGVAPEQNTGNRTYQVKESWGDELSREPSRYGELRAGWRRGARFKQLGMDGLYLSGYVGQTSPDAAAQAEGMSDAELIATHNRLSSQINKNYVGGISGFARTPEGQQIGSQLEAIEKELHARDLGFAHASEMSGKRGEVDYRSWTSDPEVATEVNRLSQFGNRDAEIAELYLQGMSSGDMSAAKRAMLASAAMYAKENNVDMDTAYAKVEGDAFNAVMRDRLASEMDAIYNEEKAAQEARQAAATEGINPGVSPADAANFELQSRRAGNERETLNTMTRRAINESPASKMYYNMQMRSYMREGMDPMHAKAAAMNDLRNLFRDREVERMSPSGDWGYVGGSAFYNNMPAELFRGLTNLATGDYESDQILDESYARYGEEKASTMAKVGASVAPFVVDMALGSFKVPGLVAKIGQQTISKGLLYGARWSLGVADDVILRRMGGNILYRTLMGGLGGGLNFMTYNAMSAAVRGFKDNNFGWNTVVEEGKRGFADGIVFGGVNGLAGKLTDVAKGAWAIPAELGVLAVEGGTFTALDYMRTGELTPESVGTSFGMAIAVRMMHFGQWASDVAARVNGTKWKNTVTGPVRLSKETRDELQDRYPEICRLMSDGELAKAMVKGATGKVKSQDALDTGVAIDKEWEAMQNDSSVPFEVRRMVNYALNGQVVPKPVTCNYRITEKVEGEDGETPGVVTTYGETLDINGNVIDRYKLESEKDRVNFEQGVALEAERNRIGLEQNAYVAKEYYPHLQDAVEAVAAEYGMDPNELLDNYYKKDIKGKAMRKAVDKVEQLYLAEIEGKTDIVSTVNDKYGVDIEEALKVPIHERTEAEHNAIEEYEQRLTGRYDEAQDKSTAELVAEDMEQSHNDGFEAQGDERADIKERLEDAANALTEMRIDPRQFDSIDENAISDWLESSGNNADEVDAVMEYLDARSAFEGIRDRVQDDAGKRIEEATKETDDRTNNDTGMIHPVVMGDDREAFVVAGRVEVKADGTIDLEKSDRDIVVRYPDEEQPVMTTADKIKSGEPTIDPEAAKQETADGIMQEVAGEAVSQMNRDLAFNDGDTLTVLVDGKPVELTVVGTDPNTGNPILQDSAGRRAPAYPDIVQQMHDEWREWVKNGGDRQQQEAPVVEQPTQSAGPRDNAAPVEELPAEEQAAGPAIMPTPGQGDPQKMLNYFRASGISDRVADRTITNNIVAANERLNKAERELNESKETDPQKLVELENAVDMAQRELYYWNAVARLKNGGGETSAQQRPTEQAGAPVAENEMQPVEEPTAEIGGTAEEYQGDGMSDEMRERMDDGTGIVGIVDNIARQLGLKVRDWDGPEGIPGYIDPDNGVIYINRNRVEGTRDTYRFTLGHELTHGLKKLAEDMGRPELYEALRDAALSTVRVREGSGYDKFVSDLMNRYRSAHYMDAYGEAIAAGRSKAEAIEAGRAEADRVTQDFIEEEIVCDTVGELLSGDESRARELLKQVEDKSVMQRIKDYFTELLTKCRDAFGKGSKEYDDLDGVINRFNEMYNEVLKQREENDRTGKSVDSVVAEAEQMTETNPTDGQKESGNYRKGHVKVDGFDISIEQPKGSVRSGVDADGKEWSQEMHNTYGYIRGTEGVDGDHIDVFLSDHLDGWNGNVYVVDQVNKDRSFDEHKVMYGFNSEQEARDAYLSNYEEGWTGLGVITGVSREEFKKWVDSSHRKNKPFAEYKNVKPLQSTGTEDRARFSISERTDEAGNEVYTETREDGTKDREVVTMPDGSRYVTWFDEAGRKKEKLDYFPNGEVRQVSNYDSNGELTRQIQYDENRRAIRHWEPRIGTAWERDKNGVARGMSNGVEMVRYSLSEAQTHSENFKKWFGDWENDPENASKVVDENGEPKVVLHGTPNGDFYIFDSEKAGSNTDQGWLGTGFYFYGNAPEYASQYAGKNGRVLQVYLDIKNPYIASVEEFNRLAEANDPEMSRRFREQLEDEGYDGVYYNGDLNEEWVAFRPEQIKSATENNGDFSRENPDIRYSLGDTFYSNAARAVEGVKQEKAKAEQWKAMLTKAGGIKAGEDKWMGLSTWLDEHKGETLTKDEVRKFVADNGIEMEEVGYQEGVVEPRIPEKVYEDFEDYYNRWTDDDFDTPLDHLEYAWNVYCNISPRWIRDSIVPHLYHDGTWDLRIADRNILKEHVGINSDYSINRTRLEYTTEGLENKREIAFVVPGVEPYQETDEIHFGPENQGRAVMWVRFGEARDADGNRVLVIDEIQSNRHQDAREKGYKDPALTERLKQIQQEIDAATKEFGDFNDTLRQKYGVSTNYTKLEKTREEWGWDLRLVPDENVLTEEEVSKWNEGNSRLEALREEKDKLIQEDMRTDGVPAAPFEKNWHEVAMKRMLRLAAEEGFDKVAWTTGGQQAERYDIGKRVDKIEVHDLYDGLHEVQGFKDGKAVFSQETENGEQGLAELLGKEMARKAYSNLHEGETDYTDEKGRVSFTGDDLQIGGEGMKGFYDQMLPRFMDKYGKRWGVKTGEVTLATPGKEVMHSVDVNEDMKRSVMQGQPLFSLSEEIENYRPRDVSWERAMLDRLMETAGRNREAVDKRRDALRTLNSQAGALRRAMSKQREYDRWTVDDLVSMAKSMLKSGLYKGMSPYEVQRLVGMINQGAGREDITRQANAVFDLMMKHHVKEWENQFNKLLRIRENKIDKNGVRVQGALDPKGQRMVKALREGIAMSEKALEDRIWDCRDRMGSDDPVVAGNAADEYEGLMHAQQHYDAIGRLNEALEELRHERRTQLERVYEYWREERVDDYGNVIYRQDGEPSTVEKRRVRPEFGGVDENGNRMPVSEENKAIRKQVDATVASIEQAMRETEVELAEGYRSLCDNVGGSVAGSITRAKEWVESEKDRVSEIHHAANSDLLNTEEKLSGMDRSKEKGVANNAVVRFINSPLGSFEKFMRYFGQRSAYGEGRLFNKFMRGHSDCTDAEWRAYKEGLDAMNQKSEELFGCSWEKLMVKMRGGAFANTKGKLGIDREFPPIEVSYWVDGKRVDDTLNQDEVAYLIACSKMTDGMMKLENMGIDENMIAQLRQQVDPRMLQLADWYQHEFLPKQRTRINEVYKRMFGADMAHIDNYIHLNINDRGLVENKDINQRMAASETPSTITGSLKERKRNTKPIDLHTSILDLALEEHQKMENWIAWAEYNRDLKDLLNYKKFKNKVYNMKSVELGSGEQLWDKFSKAVAVVTGDFQGGGKHSEMDRFATNAAKFVSSGCINFRVHTALKQVLSFPAFMSDARPGDILFAAGNAMGSVQWAMENLPGFSKRWESRRVGDTRLMDTDSDYSFWRNRWVKKVNKYGMTANASVDCLTVAIGSRAVYETAKRRYLSYGYNEEQAERKALQDAYVSYNSSQQSSEGAFVSPMQVERTFLSAIGTTFRSASMGYERRVTTGARNIARMLKKGYKEDMIENTKKQMMEEGLSEEQAQRAAERVYNRQLWHSMMDVANFGYALPFLWILGPTLSYLIAGDDDKIKKDTLADLARHAMFGPIEGLTFGGVMSELGNMVVNNRVQGKEWKDLWNELKNKDLTPLPLVSRMQGLFDSFGKGWWEGINDLTGLLVQSSVGVDPNTLTDVGVAILDACNGDLDMSKEVALGLMRILQFPQSQIDNLYIDELGLNGKDLGKYSYEELARRYARYKTNRAVLPTMMRSDEANEAAEENVMKRFEAKVQERLDAMDADQLGEVFDSGDPDLKKIIGAKAAKDAGLKYDRYGKKPDSDTKPETAKAIETYQSKRLYADMAEDVLLQQAKAGAAADGDDERANKIEKTLSAITKLRNGDPKKGVKGMGVDKATDDRILERIRETRSKALKELKITR